MRKRNSISVFSIVILLCLQTISFGVSADNVDLAKAKAVGAYYLSLVKGSKAANPEEVRLVMQVNNPDMDIAAAYCFNVEGNGFVIVAGNECATPIIGFSDCDTIDPNNIPLQMRVWLDQYCEPIIAVQNAKIAPAKALQEEWDALVEQTKEPFGNTKDFILLLTDKWGQGENYTPTYNYFCPQRSSDGAYAVAGCVATSMSQIMRYWQFPRKGKGSIFYVGSLSDVNVNFAQAYYNYELMPDELSTSSSQDMIEATALLCYHAGAAVKMDYGIDGSGAVTYYNGTSYLANSLKNYFKYPSAKTYMRANFTTQKWLDTLSNELENGRPMIYCAVDNPQGTGDAAGHAFVCDGKRTVGGKDQYHINWGWYGSGNGWYDMENSTTNFRPSGTGYNFNKKHEVTVHIAPPADSLAIGEIESDVLHEAYPNPTSSHIVIPFEVTRNTPMQIISAEGRVMESVVLRAEQAAITINVSRYPKGIYFYRANGKAHKFIVK